MTRILALDIGTSSVRAQLFGDDCEPLDEAAQEEYRTSDPDEVLALIRKAIGERAQGADTVAASCFGHSLLAVDDRGKPLTPILGWRDTRSANAVDELTRRLDADAVHARTGCPLHTSFWPAKLAWLAEEDPETFRRARFVSFADYAFSHLAGDIVPSSLSLASGTGVLNVQTHSWDEELPRISDDPVGDWYPAVIDGACSNLGTGCVSRERAALMIGTSGAFRTLHETAAPAPRPGLFLYCLDERRIVEGGALSDGGNLVRWLGETLNDAEGSVADRDPAAHGLTFLTLLGGERSPGWHAHATGTIAGLTFATTPLDIRQAALEGVAFRFAEIVERMPEVEEIVATGGALLKDDDWVQIIADVLERPVAVSGVEEGSLRGAAVWALERLGRTVPDAPVERTVEPRLERAPAYRETRERQRELYRAATGTDTS